MNRQPSLSPMTPAVNTLRNRLKGRRADASDETKTTQAIKSVDCGPHVPLVPPLRKDSDVEVPLQKGARNRFTLTFDDPETEENFQVYQMVKTVSIAKFLIGVFWLMNLKENLDTIQGTTDFVVQSLSAVRIVLPFMSAVLLWWVQWKGMLDKSGLRSYNIAMFLQISGDLWAQSGIAGYRGHYIAPPLYSMCCATALTGKSWIFHAVNGSAILVVFLVANWLNCDGDDIIPKRAVMESAMQLPVMYLIGYVCDANTRTTYSTHRELQHFRTDLDQAVAKLLPEERANTVNKQTELAHSNNTLMSWVDMMADLNRALAEARKVNRLFSDAEARQAIFLATMSHELRYPLTAMLGSLEILELSPDLIPEHRELVQLVNGSGMHLKCLVNDILDFSKLTTTQREFKLSPLPFRPRMFADRLRSMFLHTAKEQGVKLSLDKSSIPLNRQLLGDETRVQQIAVNFLSNALKFTPSGGTVHLKIELRESEVQGHSVLRIAVTDSGIGMSDHLKSCLFQPFVQGEGVRYGGTGLGLTISAKLAALMGCPKIQVDSEPGKGSTFTADLVLESQSDASEPPIAVVQPSMTLKQSAQSLKGYDILLVEDVRSIRMMGQRMLSRMGATCSLAVDGFEAISQVTARQEAGDPFSAILMDLHMPNCNGLTALTTLKEKFGSDMPPVIGLTADVMDELAEKFRTSGCAEVMHKPYKMQQLCDAITDHGNPKSV